MTKKPLNRRIVCEHHAFFDQFSKQYEKQLQKGLSLTGEDAGYYAMSRIKWLARCFQKIELQPKCILDFGCGIGNSIPYLLEYLRAVQVVGLDTSRASLDEARRRNPSTSVSLVHSDEFHDQSRYNLAFCNGVFHHIPPALRGDALRMIWNALKPGGLFAFWENNPWNPGTRYVMSRVDFDRDAITITPPEARELIRKSNFEILGIDFLFIFPRALSWLRFLEPFVTSLPLGGQYMVLAKKPGATNTIY